MASSGDHRTGRRFSGGRRSSPAVYRRRRLAVIILALLVVSAIAVGGATLAGMLGRGSDALAGGSTTSEATPSPAGDPAATASTDPGSAVPSESAPASAGPSADPSAVPSPSATTPEPSAMPDADPDACESASVVVVAETDKQAYEPGEKPSLSLVVRNNGVAPCTVNVGTSQMEFVLTRDDERVFSSIDCQQASQDLERTIAPGGEERATFEWSRNRTVPGCTVVADEPGSGTYSLITRLGARSSEAVQFTLQ
ncbi:hypothetical protein [Arthrobacter sp. B1805]|uniref:hypothetical protein n=1 Tax=Arthrobacter sp. B1805 TaxID=2058892 RepID=UPI000CE35CE9|nr:hypothetical protein [Arthrobacter sp. B1805]